MILTCLLVHFYFFFNDTATTEIYTLSLHDALPISTIIAGDKPIGTLMVAIGLDIPEDRKSTRLNSSHRTISYAVFCLQKKTKTKAARPTGATTAHVPSRSPSQTR